MTNLLKQMELNLHMMNQVVKMAKRLFLFMDSLHPRKQCFLMRNGLTDKYKVYTIDCRGHGESDRMGDYTLEDLSNDLVAFTNELGLEKPIAIGYSMGSFIVLRASQISDAFEKIILIGTKGDSSDPAITNLLKENGLTVENVTKEEYGKIMRANIFAPTTKIPENMKTMRPQGKELSVEDRVAETKAIADFDNLKEIDNVNAEALVISAEYDKIVPPERGREVADALNCRFELLKDAGHMMMVEKPKEIEDLIKDFIG